MASPQEPEPAPEVVAQPPESGHADDIGAAPVELDHAGRKLRLQTELTENRMPRTVDDPPSPIVIHVRLMAEDGDPPPAIDVERLWLVDAGEAHEVRLSESINTKTRPGESVHELELPAVKLSEQFDVVADVSIDGAPARRIRAAAQRIQALH